MKAICSHVYIRVSIRDATRMQSYDVVGFIRTLGASELVDVDIDGVSPLGCYTTVST